MSGTVAEDQGSVKSEESVIGRAKFLCSYGGRIMPRPHDSLLRYVGGETRILSVPRAVTFTDLMFKLRRLCQCDSIIVKYQLPSEDLDALVSVFSDEDLDNMMEEYDRIESSDSSSRLRLFIFPSPSLSLSTGPDHGMKFVEALNGMYRKVALGPDLYVEEQKKPVVLMQPAPAVVDKSQVPVAPVQLSVAPVQLPTTTPVVPQVMQHPFTQLPQVMPYPVNPSVLPAPVSVLPAPVMQVTPPVLHSRAPLNPSILPSLLPHNVMAVPPSLAAPRVVAVTTPSSSIKVPQVPIPGPQVMAAARPSKPSGYVPLVDVSRGMLPKGMVLRQLSVDDDHNSDTPTSQSSQFNDFMLDRRDSGELLRDEDRYLMETRRDFRPLQDNKIIQHLHDPKFVRTDVPTGYILGGAGKLPAADTHLDRYLVEQTGGEAGVALAHPQVQFYVSGETTSVLTEPYSIPRAASAPAVEVHHQLQRQGSDRSEPPFHHHHQENVIPNVRACIGPDVVVQLDERFPSPVLHQLNGLRPQPQQQQQVMIPDQQVQKPIKVVPQVVAMSPFKVP